MKKRVLKIIAKVTSIVLFLAIIVSIASFSSYLFRYDEEASSTKMVKGFYALDKNSIDVMFIGSSSLFRSNSPAVFYKETGLTSYNFCSSALPFEAVMTMVKETEKYQHPSVYVIDIRRFYKQVQARRVGMYEKEEYIETLTKSMSTLVNNMPLSLNRAKLIYNFYGKVLGIDSFEWIFDYLRTHNNWKNLSFEEIKNLLYEATHYKDVNFPEYNGDYLCAKWDHVEKPDIDSFSKGIKLTDEDLAPVKEILDYAEKKNLNVLFLNPPFSVSESLYAYEKAVNEYITGRGGNILDCNQVFDELGIDYETDYYNVGHLNISGGIKASIYFANIIENIFDIEKKELTLSQREYWDNLYDSWYTEKAEGLLDQLNKMIEKGQG